MIEFVAGVGAGVVVLLAFFRWMWGRATDVAIARGPCAHCRRLLDVTETGPDHEHWRVCPKHPAREVVADLRSALEDCHDALQEVLPPGVTWDGLPRLTGNDAWVGLKDRIDAALTFSERAGTVTKA